MDIRIQKSKLQIQQAFLDLLSKQRFEAITVQSILNASSTNRSTFYKYYRDKCDLASQMCDDIFRKFQYNIDKRLQANNFSDTTLSTPEFYATLFDERRTISLLWQIQTDEIHLYQDMKKYLADIFPRIYFGSASLSAEETVISAQLWSSIIMNLLQLMFQSEAPWTINEIFGYLAPIMKPFDNDENFPK